MASKKRGRTSTGSEEMSKCPICMESWKDSGEHQICALKCGHLFGKSCVEEAIKTSRTKRCPLCRMPAKLKDIRTLFFAKVMVHDTGRENRLVQELGEERESRINIERRNAEKQLQIQRMREDIRSAKLSEAKLKKKVSDMELQLRGAKSKIRKLLHERQQLCSQAAAASGIITTVADLSSASSKVAAAASSEAANDVTAPPAVPQTTLHQAGEAQIVAAAQTCKTLGSRVLATVPVDANVCPGMLLLSAEVSSTYPSQASFGIRLVRSWDIAAGGPPNFIRAHTKPIRDIKVSPPEHNDALVATASLDKTLKLVDLRSGAVALSFSHCCPLWSCGWVGQHQIISGQTNGQIALNDLRFPKRAASMAKHPNPAPIYSLCTGLSKGSILAGSFKGVARFELSSAGQLVPTPGSAFCFPDGMDSAPMSLSADPAGGKVVASWRTRGERQAQHVIYGQDSGVLNSQLVSTAIASGFYWSSVLSRTHLVGNKIISGDESSNGGCVWSAETGRLLYRLEPHITKNSAASPNSFVLDAAKVGNQCIATLSERELKIFRNLEL